MLLWTDFGEKPSVRGGSLLGSFQALKPLPQQGALLDSALERRGGIFGGECGPRELRALSSCVPSPRTPASY